MGFIIYGCHADALLQSQDGEDGENQLKVGNDVCPNDEANKLDDPVINECFETIIPPT